MARLRRGLAWMSPSWMEQAACASHEDPDLWFPEHGQDDRQQEALRICAGCTVGTACRAYVTSMPPQPGIWGGTTEDQRTQDRRRRAAGRDRRAS